MPTKYVRFSESKAARLTRTEDIFLNPRLSVLHFQWLVLFVVGFGYLFINRSWDTILHPVFNTLYQRFQNGEPYMNVILLCALGAHIFISVMRIYVSFWILDYDKEFRCLITIQTPQYIKITDLVCRLFVIVMPLLVFFSLYSQGQPLPYLIFAFLVCLIWDVIMLSVLNFLEKTHGESEDLKCFKDYFTSFKIKLEIWKRFDFYFLVLALIEAGILYYIHNNFKDLDIIQHSEGITMGIAAFAVVYLGLEYKELKSLFAPKIRESEFVKMFKTEFGHSNRAPRVCLTKLLLTNRVQKEIE